MKTANGIKQSTRERIENTIREMNEAECGMTISGVAKEAGISNAAIHNRYPDLASQIRKLAGKAAERNARKDMSMRRGKIKTLDEQRRALRNELTELKKKLNKARSVNVALDQENQSFRAENEDLKCQLAEILIVKNQI